MDGNTIQIAKTLACEWWNGKPWNTLAARDQRDALMEAREIFKAEHDGYAEGEKCPCVCGERPDGGGRELADSTCELCNGSGRVGKTVDQVEAAMERWPKC